jgi:diguanylate cyclase (GGDEF)-like protein/PAS domain S-box-containing protein
MSKKTSAQDQRLLRAVAEDKLAGMSAQESASLPNEELLHELQVHQIELEMQNDTLRQAQIALEESRDRYVDLYEFAPVGYVTLTSKGLIKEINLTGAAMLGEERLKLLHRPFAGFVSADERARWYREFSNNMLCCDKQHCEFLLQRVDGSSFHALMNCLLSEKGDARITLTDITERKRTEAEIFAAQSQLAGLFDALPDLLFEVDLDGRYLNFHSSHPELLATPAEKIIGRTVREILPPEVADVAMSALREANKTGHSRGRQYALQLPQGKLWFELSIARKPVKEGSEPRFIVLARDITERMQAEEEIRALNLGLEEQVRERTRELLAKEEQLRETLALKDSILMKSPLGIAAYRQDGQCVMANPALASIVGGTQAQLLKQNFRQLSAWTDSGLLTAAESALNSGARVEREVRYPTSFGRDIWARGQLSLFTKRSEPHLLLMLENITEKRAAEEELRLAASVFENSSEGILVTDADGAILSVNPAFCKITGYTEDEALGQKASLLRSGRHEPDFYRSLWDALAKEGFWQGDIWNRRKNNEDYLALITINRIEGDAGAPLRYVSVFHDITELRRKDEQIRHQAFHDTLTGLPNRALMQDRLLHALERVQREGGRLSLTFLDLDRFKAINDGLGHDIGDLLLQEVARRIKSRMRTSDTVARLGGDEFVVLMEDLHEAGDSASLAQELIAEIARPMELNGHAVEISASMGIALYPEDGKTPLDLMKRADMAMYAAKTAGRNVYRFYQQDMQDQISQRLSLEMELRSAIALHELALHYQPKIDLATGKILGVEALVRWRHPLRGLLLPAEFVPLAEEFGLICELGDWVLDEVCRQLAVWRIAGHTFKCAFNVSAYQLETGDLAARIAELTAQHGIAPSDLEIELTESTVMTYSKYAASMLARLREIGVTVAVSDFCAGYSSLNYLRQLPIDILKINHSFVTDADSNVEDAEIVKTVLALGRMFKLTMEAEGVETGHQADLLQSFGCGIAQGYFFSRPLPASEFGDWLNTAIDASGSRL